MGGTEVNVSVRGITPNTTYPAHVHARACGDNEGGGHYLIDPGDQGVVATNEIWPNVTSEANGAGSGRAFVNHVARPDAVSVVIHDPANGNKLVCADLRWPVP